MGLTYEDFRKMALDDSLNDNEKVGFPDFYRAGRETAIVSDIVSKLGSFDGRRGTLLDVGPGCSLVARLLIDLAANNEWAIHLIDSEEMLGRLPNRANVTKHAGLFPECPNLLTDLRERVDSLLVYSVLHYVFREGNLWNFVDACLSLLAPGGKFLLGDLPNVSKRNRFFSSDAGVAFHQQFTGSNSLPRLSKEGPKTGNIDDAVVLGILMRTRSAGFEAYVVPQPPDLPMANRREDVLIVRP